MAKTKLNVGCGVDYRDGFINIDGSDRLPRVDLVLDFSRDELTSHFKPESVDFILSNDIIEHLFHWQAVRMLTNFFTILKPGGRCELRVPDAKYIIKTRKYGIEKKLNLLFGGQDVPQGANPDMDNSRKYYPEYFCHKYGWTRKRMHRELTTIGFREIQINRVNTNLVIKAQKKSSSDYRSLRQ